MKLVTFVPESNAMPRLGCERGNTVVDLASLCAASGEPVPATMLDFIRAGQPALAAARKALAMIPRTSLPTFSYAIDEVQLLAPIPCPGKILCSGINYHGHFKENPSAKMPDEPFFFAKLPSAVIGPGTPIVLPARAPNKVDYEVEFAVVVGKRLARTPEAEILEAIFGYTILHDVSARDVQLKDNQITLGKNFDTFSPIGPCIATADEISEPARVGLRTRLNGRTMQDGSTSDWVFSLPRLLSSLSQVMTLEPGDVVSTGTPAGVGLFQKPSLYLRAGDVVELEIDGIGVLRNPVVSPP